MHAQCKKKNLSIILLLLGTILFFANNHILSIAIPLLINNEGWGLQIVGYCTAGMGFLTIVMKFITPWLIKEIKIKHLVVITLIVLSGISTGFIFSNSALSIIILRCLFGIPFSIFPIINLIVITNTSQTEEELISNTSIIGMAMPISMVLSPLLTESLINAFSFKVVFFVASIASFICLFLYLQGLKTLTFKQAIQADNTNKEVTLKSVVTSSSFKRMLSILLSFFFLGVVDILILTYFPLIAESTQHKYSFFFMLFSVSMVISQKLYIKIKLSNKTKLIIGYILLLLSSLLAGLSNISFYVFSIISAIAFGVGYSLIETTTNTLVMLEENSSILITIQQLIISIGRTFGPWFITLFSNNIQHLKLCFVLIAISLLLPVLSISITKPKS